MLWTLRLLTVESFKFCQGVQRIKRQLDTIRTQLVYSVVLWKIMENYVILCHKQGAQQRLNYQASYHKCLNCFSIGHTALEDCQ